MNGQSWSWVLSVAGLIGFILAGKKIWWAWYVNIANQGIWLAYSIVTEQWGFLVAAFAYLFVFTKNAVEWTVEHKGLSPFHWRKTKLAHRLGLDSPSFHLINTCWCQKEDLFDWQKALEEIFERIRSIGYIPPNGLKEKNRDEDFDIGYNRTSFLQKDWLNDIEESFSEDVYFSQNKWKPAADMDDLPEPPTNYVTTYNVDRRSICPVHNRAHGWYVCIPNKKDLEKNV